MAYLLKMVSSMAMLNTQMVCLSSDSMLARPHVMVFLLGLFLFLLGSIPVLCDVMSFSIFVYPLVNIQKAIENGHLII